MNIINGSNGKDEATIIKNPNQCLEKFKAKKIQLLDHQKKPVLYLFNNRGLLLFHGVGSGKTITTIASTECLLNSFPDKEVLVITPKSLVDNFLKELANFEVDDPSKYNITTINKFFIDNRKKTDKELKEYLQNKILIIDEAHNLKYNKKNNNPTYKDFEELQDLEIPITDKLKGSISSFFVRICKFPFRVILLTATPVLNRPYDIISLISMIKGTDNISMSEFINTVYNVQKDFMQNNFNWLGCRHWKV